MSELHSNTLLKRRQYNRIFIVKLEVLFRN